MTAPVPPVDLDQLETALTAELDSLDEGKHHLWCSRCHPEWVARPLGAELGVPFTAWCGVRAVILVSHPDDTLPPGFCRACNDPAVPCAACGWLPTDGGS